MSVGRLEEKSAGDITSLFFSMSVSMFKFYLVPEFAL